MIFAGVGTNSHHTVFINKGLVHDCFDSGMAMTIKLALILVTSIPEPQNDVLNCSRKHCFNVLFSKHMVILKCVSQKQRGIEILDQLVQRF